MSDTGLYGPVSQGTPLAGVQGVQGGSAALALTPGATPGTMQTGNLPDLSKYGVTGADAIKVIQNDPRYTAYVWLLYTPLAPTIIQLAAEGVTDTNAIQNAIESNPAWGSLNQSMVNVILQLSTPTGAQTFYQTLQQQEATVQATFQQMGLQPTQGQINALAFQSLYNNWTPQQLSNHLHQAVQVDPDGTFHLAYYYKNSQGQAIDVFSGRQAFYGPNGEAATPDEATAKKLWGTNYQTGNFNGQTVFYGNGTAPQGTGTAAGGAPMGGDLVSTEQALTTYAKQFLLSVPPQQVASWAASIVQGQYKLQDIQASIQTMALSKYGNNPDLVAAIQRGETPQAYFQPYQQAIANQLSISPDTIDFNNPQYASLLTTTDPKTGMTASNPIWAVEQTVRTDPKYGYQYTPNARANAYSMVSQLAQTFGMENFSGMGGAGITPLGG